MATLSLISQKGGVGKTTIAVNVSYSLARRGWKVLLVDADMQGGVGFSLTERSKDAVGYYDFLSEIETNEAARLDETIIRTNLPDLSLLTRGSRRALDHALEGAGADGAVYERIRVLNDLIASLGHDIVIYDTPTGITSVSTGISRVVDSLLIPEQPSPLCLRSLPQILRMVAAARSINPASEKPRLAGFVLSMTDPDDPSNLMDQREFRDLLPIELVLETVIPFHRDFREASRVGVPVAMMRERPSASALIFDQLAAELELRLSLYEDEENPIQDRDDYARLVD
ncbi:MAG TPA: ParA family protein [Verrucomicrobiales bacterium]|nr:ParA family protein [Verrucomicrobiales bacterium]